MALGASACIFPIHVHISAQMLVFISILRIEIAIELCFKFQLLSCDMKLLAQVVQ